MAGALHGQIIPIGHSQTQILELKKIATTKQNNFYNKKNNLKLTI